MSSLFLRSMKMIKLTESQEFKKIGNVNNTNFKGMLLSYII